MAKIYWHEQSLSLDLIRELDIEGVFGNPKLFGSHIHNMLDLERMDEFKNDEGKAYYAKYTNDKDPSADKDFIKAYMGKNPKDIWGSVLTQDVMKDENFGGIVLCDPEETYVYWAQRREWILNFLSELREKCELYSIKRKDVQVFVQVMDVIAINNLYHLVDGILIFPLNGIIQSSRFILPLGGYLDIGNQDFAETARDTLNKVSEFIGVDRDIDESFDDFIIRLQFHVFQMEVEKIRFTINGGKLKEFEYRGKRIDEDLVFDLAIIKGYPGSNNMLEMAEDMKRSIEKSIETGDTESVVKSLADIYSILLGRVKFGVEIDTSNFNLSEIVSRDISNALNYGMKMSDLISKIRDQKFAEKVAIMKLKLDQDKLEIERTKAIDAGKEPPKQAEVLTILDNLDETDTKEFLQGYGKSVKTKLITDSKKDI